MFTRQDKEVCLLGQLPCVSPWTRPIIGLAVEPIHDNALPSRLPTVPRKDPNRRKFNVTVWITYLDPRLHLFRDLELLPQDA